MSTPKRQGATAKCPFCGAKPATLFYRSVRRGGEDKVHAQCPNCQAGGPVAISEEEAKTLWDSRPQSPLKAILFGS